MSWLSRRRGRRGLGSVEDRGELRERVAEERAVGVDHLEAEPCGRAVGEESFERALSVVQRDSGRRGWAGLSGCWFGELVHVGLSGLLCAPAGGAQRVDELLGVLADLDGELPALLAGVLVGAERAMDLPVDVLQGSGARPG